MRILKTEKGLTLDQEQYTQNILEQFNMQDCEPSKTPAENNLKLEVAQEHSVRVDSHVFRSLVGSLLYLAKQTRPDFTWITSTSDSTLVGETDAHWSGDVNDKRSITGYYFKL